MSLYDFWYFGGFNPIKNEGMVSKNRGKGTGYWLMVSKYGAFNDYIGLCNMLR